MAEKELGVSCELIDLKTVYPYDLEIMTKSIRKTGRGIVSHEAPVTAGLGGEIASKLQEVCFDHLEAPIKRVCGYDTPFPHVQEVLYYPDRFKIFEAIKQTVNY